MSKFQGFSMQELLILRYALHKARIADDGLGKTDAPVGLAMENEVSARIDRLIEMRVRFNAIRQRA